MKNWRFACIAGSLVLSASVAQAADNAIIVTPGSGVTIRSKDIGSGVQSPVHILGDTSGNPIYGTAGTANANVISIQGIASGTALGVSAASGAIASGAVASGAVASGAIASGAFASGSIGSGAIASGALASGSLALNAGTDGWNVTMGLKADAATCVTGNTEMACLRQIDADIKGTGAVNGVNASGTSVTAATEAPLFDGGRAQNAEATAVTNGQKVGAAFDLVGKQIVLPYANPENFVSGVITSAMTGTTTTSLIAAPAAGLRNYITQCTFSNSHATVGTDMILQDGSGGTTIYLAPAAPAFGGSTITFPTPLRQPTTATALFVANVTTGANTKASCSGYKGA